MAKFRKSDKADGEALSADPHTDPSTGGSGANSQAGKGSSAASTPDIPPQVYAKTIEALDSSFSMAMGEMLMNTASAQQQLHVMADAALTQDVEIILGNAAKAAQSGGGVS